MTWDHFLTGTVYEGEFGGPLDLFAKVHTALRFVVELNVLCEQLTVVWNSALQQDTDPAKSDDLMQYYDNNYYYYLFTASSCVERHRDGIVYSLWDAPELLALRMERAGAPKLSQAVED